MRSAHIAMLMLAASPTAHADFSFTMTQKSGPGGEQVVKHYVKGQKKKEERGTIATIMDFDAQTLTTIDNAAKTYKVARFSDLGNTPATVDVQAEVKSTGQKKTINGFNASQVILTMQVDMPQAQQAGIKGQMEIELWLSRDVPGSQELAAFYKKNAARWPVGASGGGGNPSMQKAMAKLQQQLAELDGVPVMEVIRMKSGGGAGPSAAQMQQMAQARAQLEAMTKQGGAQAAAAQQALTRMGGMGSGSGSGSGTLFEITMEAGNFSSSAVPDSAFEVPAGYQKLEK
jgi:hypothetical protein